MVLMNIKKMVNFEKNQNLSNWQVVLVTPTLSKWNNHLLSEFSNANLRN